MINRKYFWGSPRKSCSIVLPTEVAVAFCAALCCNFSNILEVYTSLPVSDWISMGICSGRRVNIKSRMCLIWRVAWKGAWVADGTNVWQRNRIILLQGDCTLK